jgi:YHS domain-containing protein
MRFLSFTFALFTLTSTAAAKDPVDPVNQTRNHLAIKGFDVVAYFTDARPVPGSDRFTFQWMGASWQFASAAHRDQFATAPEKYAPQYGGYCSWAVGHGHTANIDPEAWRIVGGKLYLNYSKDVQKMWEKDRAKWITEADRNWPSLHK